MRKAFKCSCMCVVMVHQRCRKQVYCFLPVVWFYTVATGLCECVRFFLSVSIQEGKITERALTLVLY